jgi:hypothetical protein
LVDLPCFCRVVSQRWKSSSMCKPVTRFCNKVKNTLYTSNQWLKTYPTFVELWFSSCNRFYSCPFYWHPVGNHLCMCNLKHSKTRMVQIKLPQLLHLPCVHGIFTFTTMFLFLYHLRRWLQVHLKHTSVHKTYYIQTILYSPYVCFSVHVSFQTHHCQLHLFSVHVSFQSFTANSIWKILQQKQTSITYH